MIQKFVNLKYEPSSEPQVGPEHDDAAAEEHVHRHAPPDDNDGAHLVLLLWVTPLNPEPKYTKDKTEIWPFPGV